MARIYTRTGDAGETGLFGGGRVSKADARVAAYGGVDELNAALGCVLALGPDDDVARLIGAAQAQLFALGAHLATPPRPRGRSPALPPLPTAAVGEMEAAIDRLEAELPPLRSFILPGGSAAGAALHFARTVCRRAERGVVALAAAGTVDASVLAYLNRFSDLLFVLARVVNHRAGVPEPTWSGSAEGDGTAVERR